MHQKRQKKKRPWLVLPRKVNKPERRLYQRLASFLAAPGPPSSSTSPSSCHVFPFSQSSLLLTMPSTNGHGQYDTALLANAQITKQQLQVISFRFYSSRTPPTGLFVGRIYHRPPSTTRPTKNRTPTRPRSSRTRTSSGGHSPRQTPPILADDKRDRHTLYRRHSRPRSYHWWCSRRIGVEEGQRRR